MKRLTITALALLALTALPGAAFGHALVDCAPQSPCNQTSGPQGTGTGDALWLAFGKINSNFSALPPALFNANAIPAGSGGTGETGTITGIVKANGTSPFTAAEASDVAELFGCGGTTSNFLRGDGACTSTLTGGLTVTGGTTSLQALTATNVTFTGTLAVSGVSTLGTTNMGALTATTIAATSASINEELVAGSLAVVGNASTGALATNAPGTALAITGGTTDATAALVVNGGTSSTNYSAVFRGNSGSAWYETIYGDGGVAVGGPSGGDCGLGCINAQTIEQNGVPLTQVYAPTKTLTAAYTLSSSDCGSIINMNNNSISVDTATMPAGCIVRMVEGASPASITVTGGSTLFWAGNTTTGNRTLGAATAIGQAMLIIINGYGILSGWGIS